MNALAFMKVCFAVFCMLVLFPTILHAKADAELRKKAKAVLHRHLHDYDPGEAHDSLIDINGDGYADIIIEFYYNSGSGLKNGADLIMYDTVKKDFDARHIIRLVNPTFYFSQHRVVSYYVASGGGEAKKHHWHGIKLRLLENIVVDADNQKPLPFTFTKKDHITGKITKWKAAEIALPREYNYYNYTPLVAAPHYLLHKH